MFACEPHHVAPEAPWIEMGRTGPHRFVGEGRFVYALVKYWCCKRLIREGGFGQFDGLVPVEGGEGS